MRRRRSQDRLPDFSQPRPAVLPTAIVAGRAATHPGSPGQPVWVDRLLYVPAVRQAIGHGGTNDNGCGGRHPRRRWHATWFRDRILGSTGKRGARRSTCPGARRARRVPLRCCSVRICGAGLSAGGDGQMAFASRLGYASRGSGASGAPYAYCCLARPLRTGVVDGGSRPCSGRADDRREDSQHRGTRGRDADVSASNRGSTRTRRVCAQGTQPSPAGLALDAGHTTAQSVTSSVSVTSGCDLGQRLSAHALVIALVLVGLGCHMAVSIARSSPEILQGPTPVDEGRVCPAAGIPVAQACPDRAAPTGSRWSATHLPNDLHPGGAV
jgi:hypothetical protein